MNLFCLSTFTDTIIRLWSIRIKLKNLKKAEVVLVEMNWGCKVPVSQSKIKEFSELLDKDN
jgi:hypothetical protein